MGESKLNCGEKFAKWFLVALNIVFVLLGLVLFILGMVVRFAPNTILNNYLQPLLAENNQNQGQFANQIQTQLNNVDLSQIFSAVGIAIIIVGVVMLMVGFLGLFGACCQVRCMLIAYAVIVIVVLLIQFGLCIAYFTQKTAIDRVVKSSLKDIINKHYKGERATDAYSAALNFLFVEGKCCGVYNHTDMHTATGWSRRYFLNGQTYLLTHPFTCCKLQGTFPNYQQPADLTCAVTPTTANSNFNVGCFQVIDQYIANNITTSIIVVFVIFAAVEIAAVVFAILLTVAAGRGDW